MYTLSAASLLYFLFYFLETKCPLFILMIFFVIKIIQNYKLMQCKENQQQPEMMHKKILFIL